jgi:hypothetical protein
LVKNQRSAPLHGEVGDGEAKIVAWFQWFHNPTIAKCGLGRKESPKNRASPNPVKRIIPAVGVRASDNALRTWQNASSRHPRLNIKWLETVIGTR